MKICFFKSTSGFKWNTSKYSKITYEKNYSCQAADLQILNTTCQPALPCCCFCFVFLFCAASPANFWLFPLHVVFFFIHLIFPYVFRITFPKLYIFALIKQKKVKFWSAHFFQFRSNRLLSFLRQCCTAFSHFSVFVLIHPHYILLTDISFLCLCFC